MGQQNRTELTATAHITALNFTALHVTKISSTVDISLSASRLFRIQGSGYSWSAGESTGLNWVPPEPPPFALSFTWLLEDEGRYRKVRTNGGSKPLIATKYLWEGDRAALHSCYGTMNSMIPLRLRLKTARPDLCYDKISCAPPLPSVSFPGGGARQLHCTPLRQKKHKMKNDITDWRLQCALSITSLSRCRSNTSHRWLSYRSPLMLSSRSTSRSSTHKRSHSVPCRARNVPGSWWVWRDGRAPIRHPLGAPGVR
jgi:hypothetical protein